MQVWFKGLLMVFGLTLIVFGGLSGCSTPDPDNTSARPWSQPRNWEHGLPTNIMEGR